MSEFLGEARVLIVPDTTGFRTALEEQLRTAGQACRGSCPAAVTVKRGSDSADDRGTNAAAQAGINAASRPPCGHCTDGVDMSADDRCCCEALALAQQSGRRG